MSSLPDSYYMHFALHLAQKGLGYTSPNPCVGAVLVKNNKIIGRGYHKKFGGPHAEIEALNSCRETPKGSTLYVTLEPCCHYGKTPPCSKALIQAGIKSVFIGSKDHNPIVAGKGIKALQKASIKVSIGLLKEKCQQLNEAYIKYITTHQPFVALKVAMSLDGKIATKTGQSKWITGKKARRYGHRLRQKYDAVLVGINTIMADNPHLGVYLLKGRDPLRIILDSTLKISLDSQVLRDNNCLVVTTTQAQPTKINQLEQKHIRLMVMNKKIDLQKLLTSLEKWRITSILIEGGATINAAFLEQRLVDKCYFFIAPKIIGGEKAISAVGGIGIAQLGNSHQLTKIHIKKIQDDILIEGYLNHHDTKK